MFFGTMTSIWKLFYYPPPKKQRHWRASRLFLVFLRWWSWSLVTLGGCRMSVVKAICKELPPLLQILSQLYRSSGDAEAYDIYSLWASVNGVSISYLQSEVLSDLTLLNLFLQKKIADFSKLPLMLKSALDHLNSIREIDGSCCTATERAISNLETEHGITIKGSRGPTVWKSPPLSVQQFWV